MAANSNFNRILRGAILRQLRATNVYDQIVNRGLVRGQFSEPEDTVKVQTLGDIAISDYSGTLPTPQDLETNETSISAEHSKAFAFKAPADDSASQIADAFTEEGVASLLQAAQAFVLSKFSEASLQVDHDPSSDDIRTTIGDAAIKMDNAEAPDGAENRWMVLPPSQIDEIDEDLISTLDTGLAEELVQNRFVGVYKGFRLYKAPKSQFTVTGTSPAYAHAMAGMSQSIAYSDAVLNVRRVPSTDFSGDQVDGLHVGGAKVVRDGATVDVRILQ